MDHETVDMVESNGNSALHAQDDIEIDPASFEPNPVDISLVHCAADGKFDEVKRLLDTTEADPCYQDFQTGMSVLMAASGAGHVEIVKLLLEEGAPWNAVDRQYLCAGDYAIRNGHQSVVDAIMNHAVMAEMILGSVLSTQPRTLNQAYLSKQVEYSPAGDKLLDTEGLAVMMDWEKPLMREHARFICEASRPEGGPPRVLNVGFGMGIVDTAIQEFCPGEHTIIEAHPQVYARMLESGWDKKPNVRIVQGRWQDVIASLGTFDGVFYDTYAEDDSDLKEFHTHLPSMLSPNGRYSYYNGMCPDNVFFHGVACEVTRLQLARLGFECIFEPMKVDNIGDPKTWAGVTKPYWYMDTYYIPKCIRTPPAGASQTPSMAAILSKTCVKTKSSEEPEVDPSKKTRVS